MIQSTTHARRASGALLLILCVAALCALPWLLPAGQLVAAVQMLIAALFACAFNLLAGQGGMLSSATPPTSASAPSPPSMP